MTPFDGLLARITRNRGATIAVTLGFGILPILNFASGALIALVVLLRGYLAALTVAAAACAGLALLGWISGTGPVAALVDPLGQPALSIWFPALILAMVLRSARSLALVIVASALGGCLVVIGQLTLVAHPLEFWQHMLGQSLGWLKGLEGQSDVRWHAILLEQAKLMPGVSAAGLVLSSTGLVILARYFQSRLLRPGAFGEEFRHLSVGRTVTIVASLLLVAQLFRPGIILRNLAIVVLAMFFFQGLAVVHSLFRARGWPRFGLVLLYLFMVPFWPLVPGLVSGLGLVDNWFDFRRLRRQPAGQ